jgi:hypothetical protein
MAANDRQHELWLETETVLDELIPDDVRRRMESMPWFPTMLDESASAKRRRAFHQIVRWMLEGWRLAQKPGQEHKLSAGWHEEAADVPAWWRTRTERVFSGYRDLQQRALAACGLSAPLPMADLASFVEEKIAREVSEGETVALTYPKASIDGLRTTPVLRQVHLGFHRTDLTRFFYGTAEEMARETQLASEENPAAWAAAVGQAEAIIQALGELLFLRVIGAKQDSFSTLNYLLHVPEDTVPFYSLIWEDPLPPRVDQWVAVHAQPLGILSCLDNLLTASTGCLPWQATAFLLCDEVPTLPWVVAYAREPRSTGQVEILVGGLEVPTSAVAAAYEKLRRNQGVLPTHAPKTPWPDRLVAFVNTYRQEHAQERTSKSPGEWTEIFSAFTGQYPSQPYSSPRSMMTVYNRRKSRG